MTPVALGDPSCRYLSAEERETIALETAAGRGVREIARLLGRDPSTVSRELRRNLSPRRPRAYRGLLAQHKAEQRARNALYFAEFFTLSGVDHVHVHFANRAAHTALFLKEISGIPFSVTAHGQDFMKDLGSDELLREICDAAEFVAAETDYSRDLLRWRCPDSAAKIHRVYNGMDLGRFPAAVLANRNPNSPLSTALLSTLNLINDSRSKMIAPWCNFPQVQ